MDNRTKYLIRYISPKTYSAIVSSGDKGYFISHFPYTELQPTDPVDNPAISKSFSQEALKDEILPRALLMAMSEMHDFFIKINNGSVDVQEELEYKELFIEKIKNNTFLFDGEGKTTLINWFTISFLLIQYSKSDVKEIIDTVSDLGKNPSFIISIYKRFGLVNKFDLINDTLDKYLEKMKESGRWKAIRQATFTMTFLARNYSKDRISDAKEEYIASIDEFERNTGVDANYNSLQRHTDRFTRNQHFISKRKKQEANTGAVKKQKTK